MIGTPFLTAIDPRKRIKGSRDPLGLQPIWVQMGRRIIENLTTVTTSLPGFITLLQGLYFAQRIIQEGGAELQNYTNLFLKYEQLAGYSRVLWNHEEDEEAVRGLRRIKLNLSDGRIRISARLESQILSNQKTYGLWGLYTSAARASGWIAPNDPNNFLASQARDFVEQTYISQFSKNGDEILSFLTKDQDFDPKGKHRKLSQSIAGTLPGSLSKKAREFFHQHLLCANTTGIQSRLWSQIRELNQSGGFDSDERFSFPELRELIKRCRKTNDEDLAKKLTDLTIVETAIAPIGRLFAFLLGRDGQKVPTVASELRSHWGPSLSHIDSDEFKLVIGTLKDFDQNFLSLLIECSRQLSEGRYNQAVVTLLQINSLVMKDRESDAWLKLKDECLQVRVYDDTNILPERDELNDLWINTYFINSFKRIGFQVWGK